MPGGGSWRSRSARAWPTTRRSSAQTRPRSTPASAARVAAAPPVPWRTIWAAIGAVLLTFVLCSCVRELSRVILWLVVAVVLRRRAHAGGRPPPAPAQAPAGLVDRHRPARRPRCAGRAALRVHRAARRPGPELRRRPARLRRGRPGGTGPIGGLVERYDLEEWVEENQDQHPGVRCRQTGTPVARRPAQHLRRRSSPADDPRPDLPHGRSRARA